MGSGAQAHQGSPPEGFPGVLPSSGTSMLQGLLSGPGANPGEAPGGRSRAGWLGAEGPQVRTGRPPEKPTAGSTRAASSLPREALTRPLKTFALIGDQSFQGMWPQLVGGGGGGSGSGGRSGREVSAEEEGMGWGKFQGGGEHRPEKVEVKPGPGWVLRAETYRAGGLGAASPGAHPRGQCRRPRGPGLHPRPRASVRGGLSWQCGVVGAREGGVATPARSSPDRLLPWQARFVWKNPGRQVCAALRAPGGTRLAWASGPASIWGLPGPTWGPAEPRPGSPPGAARLQAAGGGSEGLWGGSKGSGRSCQGMKGFGLVAWPGELPMPSAQSCAEPP